MPTELRIPQSLKSDLHQHGLFPADLVMYINTNCNLRCGHCYVGNQLLDAAKYYNTEDVCAFIKQFETLDRITVLGGEPLLHRGINQILDAVVAAPIRERRVTTNLTGTFWLDVERFQDAPVRFAVSLDGHSAAIHDRIRGPGSFNETTGNVQALLQKGYDIEITHTVMAHNIKDFPLFVDLCRTLGVNRINLHRISPHGNAIANDELAVAPLDWVRFCADVEAMNGRPGDRRPPIVIRYPPLFTTRHEYRRLVEEGHYRNHAIQSFYAADRGHRIVLYGDGKIHISSELFGTDSFVGQLKNDRFVYNTSSRNEWRVLGSDDGEAAITDLNPQMAGDPAHPVTLSVSYKRHAVV